MKPVVLDLETTIRNKGEGAVGDFSGSPYSTKNKIIVVAEAMQGSKGLHTLLSYDVDGNHPEPPYALRRAAGGEPTLLVGHNLGFDLLYLMKTWPEVWEQARPHLHIWDTQQAEYLLFGQSEMYPSLDECSVRRGLPVKDDRIKQYWNDGVDTADIPKTLLLEYAEGDVTNTWYIFQDQYNEMQDDPLLFELAKIKMDDLLLTIHMQFYGMRFDLEQAARKVVELEGQLEEVFDRALHVAAPYFPDGFEFNPGSPAHLSALLFGGTAKMEVDAVVRDDEGNPVRYKSGAKKGQVKTRKEKVEIPVEGMKLSSKGVPVTVNGYSTSDEVLAKFKDKAEVVELVLRHREMTKDSSTYYRGYAALVWPDGNIHPSINHESTVTGRQSVSQPNLQNVTKGGEG